MVVCIVHDPDSSARAYIQNMLDIGFRLARWGKAESIIKGSKEQSML
jgi:hypothetical protein